MLQSLPEASRKTFADVFHPVYHVSYYMDYAVKKQLEFIDLIAEAMPIVKRSEEAIASRRRILNAKRKAQQMARDAQSSKTTKYERSDAARKRRRSNDFFSDF